MPSVIQTPLNIDFNPEEAKEYIWIPAINFGSLDDFFKVLTDMKVKQQVAFVKYIDKITHIDAGCDSPAVNKQLVFTQKFWDPQPVEALLSQCYTDLYGTSFEKLLKGGTEKYNLEGTPVEALLLEAMVKAADNDLKRMIWLGKKTIIASDLTGGSGDVSNYNQVDGVWTKLIAAVAAGKTPRYTIAENTATTTAGQVLAAGRGKEILRAVYRNQNITLKQMKAAGKRFEVTRSVYDNYSEELSSNNQLESSRTQLLNGVSTLTFEGIPLEIIDVVDTYLASDFTFGSGANAVITNPHRVLLTIKDNLQFCVDTNVPYPVAFETWTEKKEKRWYGRALYEFDVQIAFEQYCSVAY